MRTLSVRKVDDRTAEAIAQRAKSRGISMEAQVREILDQTARQWESEEPPETGRDMIERVRALFAELNDAEDGIVDEWAAAVQRSPLRTRHVRDPFSDTE